MGAAQDLKDFTIWKLKMMMNRIVDDDGKYWKKLGKICNVG